MMEDRRRGTKGGKLECRRNGENDLWGRGASKQELLLESMDLRGGLRIHMEEGSPEIKRSYLDKVAVTSRYADTFQDLEIQIRRRRRGGELGAVYRKKFSGGVRVIEPDKGDFLKEGRNPPNRSLKSSELCSKYSYWGKIIVKDLEKVKTFRGRMFS